jgi:hypothetical protein
MAETKFWDIIDGLAQAGEEPEERLEALEIALTALSLDELIACEMTFRRLLNKAHTWISGARPM